MNTPRSKKLPIVARVGRPVERVFPVEFVLSRGRPRHGVAVKAVERQLNYFLIELGEPDPWEYGRYHCTTTSNVYASVHWGFWPRGWKGGAEA